MHCRDFIEGYRRVPLSIGEDVLPSGTRYERRYIGVAAAPHPGVLPDRTGEGKGARRQRALDLPELLCCVGRRLNTPVDVAQHFDQPHDVSDGFRLTDEHRCELFDGLAMPSEVLLQ